MDPVFLDYLNEKLKAIGDGRQLWFTTDDLQCFVMLYRDKAWIDRLSAATGIGFFDSMKAEVSVDPFAFLGVGWVTGKD